MKKEIALKIDNVSKQYRLGLTGTGTLSDDLNRWWHKLRGKEDPYATVGEVNDRSVEGGDYVWAIKNINIEVKKGEILGIIGKNGAGKSTLLKILSRITGPTTGEITMNGRMASLLEVGTGFHPELTGRENIFLNGAILGMTKREINDKLDDIVEFSGCAKYVDTPVKRYSSGMRVRMGFAVAAFLEPDILVVDEVLAVGDDEFQKKAIGKMKEVSSEGDRTVLFVSHNMGSIANLCDRTVVLENGEVSFNGNTNEAIDFYLRSAVIDSPILDFRKLENDLNRTGKKAYSEFTKLTLQNNLGSPSRELLFGQECKILLSFELKADIQNLEIGVTFINSVGLNLGGLVSNWNGFKQKFEAGFHEIMITVPFMYLMPGEYFITIWMKQETEGVDDQLANCMSFTVLEAALNGNKADLTKYRHLNLTLPANWEDITKND